MNRPDPTRPDPTRPDPTRPSRFLTAYISKTKRDKNLKKIWGDVNLFKLRCIKFSKWSIERSDQDFYSNRRNFWLFSNLSTFEDRLSQKLIKLEIWNKRQKLRTLLICNLYKFWTNRLSVANVSFVRVKVKLHKKFRHFC